MRSSSNDAPRTWRLLLVVALAVTAAGAVAARKVGTMSRWTVYPANLPQHFHPSALWFSGDVGLAFGGFEPPPESIAGMGVDEWMAGFDAAILRSEGGGAFNEVYRAKGDVTQAFPIEGGKLYAYGERTHEDGSAVPFMLVSGDAGRTWSDGPKLPPGALGARFVAPGVGFAWTPAELLATSDGGAAWRSVLALSRVRQRGEAEPLPDARGGLWVADGSRIVRVSSGPSSEPASTEAAVLPTGTEILALAAATDGALFVLARIAAQAQVFQARAGAEPVRIATLRPKFSASALHAGKGRLVVSGADVPEGDAPPRHVVLVSADGGRTWRDEVPPIRQRLRPVFFEGDRALWGYGAMGRLQRLALE